MPNNVKRFESPRVKFPFKFGKQIFPSRCLQGAIGEGSSEILGWKGALAKIDCSHEMSLNTK